MLELSWSIEGEKQLSRRLRNIGEGVKDWTPAFQQAADKLKKIYSVDVFNTRGGAIDEIWAPLKPRYLAQKVKQGYPESPLVKTGFMKGSFMTEVGSDHATIWNDADYFKYHQSKEARSKIPRRIMLKLGNSQKAMVVRIFQVYWRKKIAESK